MPYAGRQPRKPTIFLSYSRADDKADRGWISRFAKDLEQELLAQAGQGITVYQDTEMGWGEDWERTLSKELDAAACLLCVVSPTFLASSHCRSELAFFSLKEAATDRDDLILPLYYLRCPELEPPLADALPEHVRVILRHQYQDWRELRGSPRNSRYRKRLSELTASLLAALARFGLDTSPQSGQAQPVITEPISAPSIIKVDQTGLGDFRTIGEAVRSVPPGSTIEVAKGRYVEDLELHKPIVILGAGIQHTRLESFDGHGAVCRANHVELRGLTILGARNTGGCIRVERGTTVVADCELTSRAGSGIYVAPEGFAVVQSCVIRDCQGGGIVVDRGALELEDCELTANEGPAVELRSTRRAELNNNRITGGKAAGISIRGIGAVVVHHNTIMGNAHESISVSDAATPLISYNHIAGGHHVGVAFKSGAAGVLSFNEIYGTAFSCVEILSNADPSVENNKIFSSKMFGLFCKEGGKGHLRNNDIYGHTWAGVSSQDRGNPIVESNRIYRNRMSGVYVIGGGKGTFKNNEIFENEQSGVTVHSEGSPAVASNKIYSNAEFGVEVRDTGGGLFEENILDQNAQGGWAVSEASPAQIIRSSTDTGPHILKNDKWSPR